MGKKTTLTKYELKRKIKELKIYIKDYEKEIRPSKILTKKRIIKRDNFKCRICSKEDNLEVHHLKPFNIGGNNHPTNLLTLCKSCHLFMHCNPNLILLEKRKHSERTKEGLKKAKDVGKRGRDKNPRKRRGGTKNTFSHL